MSKFFGGKDPFDHPFFTEPFAGFFGGRNPFNDPFFTRPFGDQLGPNRQITIEELNPDDYDDDVESSNAGKELVTKKPNKNASGGSSYRFRGVAYGGLDGMQYSCSENRMTGSDGVFLAEMKEEDKMLGESLHTISKGIHNKGHSVTTKNRSDGAVDSLQTLHNLNEDELTGFEENWKSTAEKHFPGWSTGFNSFESTGMNWIGWDGFPTWNGWGGWALPPVEHFGNSGPGEPDGDRRGKKVVQVKIE